MVCGVEPRAFEDDAYGEEELAQGVVLALRTAHQSRLLEMLVPVELDATVVATIRVNGHALPLPLT